MAAAAAEAITVDRQHVVDLADDNNYYTWDPDTMTMTEILDGREIPHPQHRQAIGYGPANPQLNTILQLIRFLAHVMSNTSERRVLYCGTHPELIQMVAQYYPEMQITICPTNELADHQEYLGWILVYDYYVRYQDVLAVCLARRGLQLADFSNSYSLPYRQAIVEAMNEHQTAVTQLLQQQIVINKTLRPIWGLWRFTLPWQQEIATCMTGELWPTIWGASNTNYSWLVTHVAPGAEILQEIYTVKRYRALLHYYNVILRGRFYRNPVTNDGQPPNYPELDNSWDSWATVHVLRLLPSTAAQQLLRNWRPQGTNTPTNPINDPFL